MHINKHKLLTASLCLLASFVTINSHAKEIVCPSLNVIHHNAEIIDKFAPSPYGDGYFAYASNEFHDGNLNWILEVDRIDASIPSNQIISYAQEAVRKIDERTEYAKDMYGIHVCRYGRYIVASSFDETMPLRLKAALKF